MALANNNPNPATRSAVVVPSDAAMLDEPARSLWVGNGGTLVVMLTDDAEPRTFVNVAPGVFPVSVKKVLASGTTASGIIALMG